jgi:Rrf2 family protein
MLRLSREADYSLLAMVYIAAQPAGQLAYRRDIASHYNIPREFLAKVLQKLSRHGLVKSFRGMQGGYQLAREADRITLADVIEAVDGPLALVDCQGPPYDCGQESACTVKSVMTEVQQGIRQVLCGVTLQDMRTRLAENGGGAGRLLSVKGSAR